MIMLGDTSASYYQRIALYSSLMNKADATPAEWCDMLEAYYYNNGLYNLVQQALYENAIWTPAMKPLRGPAHRAVEFYVSKLWPGALSSLPIQAKNKKVIDAIAKIDAWSNWAQLKQTQARWFANFGDMFIKVTTREGADNKVKSVYKEAIKPRHVTDIEEDERGFVTHIRIDVPNGTKTYTEVWDKAQNSYRVWNAHGFGARADLEQLGEPDEKKNITDFGLDFIPIVHAKFIDVGEVRGVGCFVHALDKIDEANRQATRLHQILYRYNRATTAIMANGTDPSGRPLPAPVLDDGGGHKTGGDDYEKSDDDDIMLLPGMTKAEHLVPNINYDAALAILNAQMKELANDLPEIQYFDLIDKGDVSGVALMRMLGPAIDKVIDARGSGESAIVRANMIAMTLGVKHRLEGFVDLGVYDNGDFDHTFTPRDVIPLSAKERAEAVKAEVDMGSDLPSAMRRYGYAEADISDVLDSREYKMRLEKQLWEAVKAAEGSAAPETVLRRLGWKDDMLADFGAHKLAAIIADQEDTTPPFGQ